jgi:hypothetical protein
MEKISADQAAQVYAEVPGVLRALMTERDELRTKLAAANTKLSEFEKSDRIEKIARTMESKGVDPGSSFDEKVERIKEAADRGRSLDVIEEAVEMTAPNGALGKLAGAEASGNGADQLTSYLLGGLSE